MSRYIYFLCLLFFINIVFCYEYMDVNPNYRPIQKLRRSKIERNQKMNEDRMVDNDMANIDVAGFIQSPDNDRLDDNDQFKVIDDKSDQLSANNNFNSLIEANLEEYQDKNEDYLSKDAHEESIFEVKPQRYRDESLSSLYVKDIENQKHHDDFLTQNNLKHMEKKCAFRKMKIPFFSHDKRKTTQTKKNKKRKLFNFNSKKLKSKTQKLTTFLTSTTSKTTESTLYKLSKRSYLEKMCPICRRKFIARRSQYEDGQPNDIIHNSRQFYQNRQQFDEDMNHIDNYNNKPKMKVAEPEHLIKERLPSNRLNAEVRK